MLRIVEVNIEKQSTITVYCPGTTEGDFEKARKGDFFKIKVNDKQYYFKLIGITIKILFDRKTYFNLMDIGYYNSIRKENIVKLYDFFKEDIEIEKVNDEKEIKKIEQESRYYKYEKKYCSCGSLLDSSNVCLNKECPLKLKEIEEKINKIFFDEFNIK